LIPSRVSDYPQVVNSNPMANLPSAAPDNALGLLREVTMSQRPNRYVLRLLAVKENIMSYLRGPKNP
jgi:hypothetical protein